MIDLDARPEDPRSGSPSLSRREMLGLLATTGAGAMLAPIIRSGAVLAAETPKKGGQIVVALSQEPTVFNPNRPHIEVDRGVHFGLFDSLWRVDEKAQFLPNLAVEMPTVKNGGIQKNGLEYLVKLAEGRQVARRQAVHLEGREVHARADHESQVRGLQQGRARSGGERRDARRVHRADPTQGALRPLHDGVGRHLHRARPHPGGRGRSQHRRVQHQEPGGHGAVQARQPRGRRPPRPRGQSRVPHGSARPRASDLQVHPGPHRPVHAVQEAARWT